MAVIVNESCTYPILFLISSSDGLSGGDSDLNGGSKASSLGSAYFSCSLSSPCSPAVMTPSLPKRILSPALSPIMPIRSEGSPLVVNDACDSESQLQPAQRNQDAGAISQRRGCDQAAEVGLTQYQPAVDDADP